MDRIARAAGARSPGDPAAQRGRAGRPPAHRPGPGREHLGPPLPRRGRCPHRLPRALAGAGGGAGRQDGREPDARDRPLALLPRRRVHRQRRAPDEVAGHGPPPGGRPHRDPHRDDRHGPGMRRGLHRRSRRRRPGSDPRTWSSPSRTPPTVPDSGPTVASRTTMIVGGLIARAVAELRDRVLAWPQIGSATGIVGAVAAIERFRDAARAAQEAGPVEITLHHEPPECADLRRVHLPGRRLSDLRLGRRRGRGGGRSRHAGRPARCTSPRSARWAGPSIRPCARARSRAARSRRSAGRSWRRSSSTSGRYLNDRLATYIIPTILDTPRSTSTCWSSPGRAARSAPRESASCRWTAARRRSPRPSRTPPGSA